MHRLGVLISCAIFLTACGGGGSGSSGTKSTGSGSSSPPGSAVVVNVLSGQTSTGVDIAVPAPAASPAPNAQFLGVCGGSCGSGAAAFSTGDVIHRGETSGVILFGPGLSGNMQIKISGAGDIAVSNIVGIMAKDGTPGIQFTAVVSSGATLGGRTVFLQTAQNDITTFTGGLEVVP